MAKRTKYADDDTESVWELARRRLPFLLVGLGLGALLSLVTSRFEAVFLANVRIAFFMPFVIYMADAVGTQTENIYARDLRTKHVRFHNYFFKEAALGVLLGGLSAAATAGVTLLWFGSVDLTLAVSLATFCAISVAPLVALLVTELLELEHTDPAVGAGPIATIIQDTLTVMIYGTIASLILLA